MKCYAVIDTNVVVSAFLSVMKKSDIGDSSPFKVLSIVLDDKNRVTPIFNDEILEEYKEVLSRSEFNIRKSIIGRFLNDIRNVGKTVEGIETDEELPDPKDVVFYRVALSGRQTQNTYLVTGNKKHFPVKEFIVSPSEFIEIVKHNR